MIDIIENGHLSGNDNPWYNHSCRIKGAGSKIFPFSVTCAAFG